MSVLTETTFKRIADIARRRWGLSLGERKMQLVANRLTSHLRKSGGGEIEDYVSRLERNPTEDDMLVLFDILSTNVTSFFRDPAHFAFLERELYTGLAKGTLALPGKRLRIWSAACSIGAEPYSLAMQALELLPPAAGYDVKILATDLANKALVGCREGIYTESQLSGLSPSSISSKSEREITLADVPFMSPERAFFESEYSIAKCGVCSEMSKFI
jgi:chemotaxis protein methyltransferase CheR